ncbi:fungal zn(2)-Cys(6) binuclear cluster domain-containing protein [Fusarium austroafricanum]|uniref:Fungal zn(2)-Cys(6) binuclear cluster domain-containing protein n=1 Tax=Fusarium austroafricanum TaxID=2364996 RepID=A0A8H4KBA1_9HYPO|nr:fungal zn(2)-Cys(6) binuclear cluster domain-containing protein [Fusarium austroafricanum]
MHYWLVTASLFESFESDQNQYPSNILDTDAKEIVAHARTCLRTLIRLYYRSHDDDSYELFTVLLAQYIGFSALDTTAQGITDKSIQEINGSGILICAHIFRGQSRMSYLSDAVLRIMDKHVPQNLHNRISNLIGKSEKDDMRAMVLPVKGDWPILKTYRHYSHRDERELVNLFKVITEASLDNEEDDDSLVDEVVGL